MRLWLSHRPEVSLREQLATQITLGILCGELKVGQRLPSTREMARRFHLHPNTVSAGYKQLGREGWLEFRRGSGVFVRRRKREGSAPPAVALDQLIADFFADARGLHIPLARVQARLRQCLDSQPPHRFVLIDPDEELRRIVLAEVRGAVSVPVEACGPRAGSIAKAITGAIALAMPSQVALVRRLLPPGVELIALRVRSIPSSLAEWLPAPASALVGVASRWPRFMKLANVMLVAAGFDPNQLIFRDPRKRNWRRGLEEAAVVVCDCVTADQLPKTIRPIVFRVLSEESIGEMRDYEKSLH